MRWPTVRLICHRELRDLSRDRRTLLLLLGLPVLLYPLFGLIGFLFALTTLDQASRVGIVGIAHLPPDSATVRSPVAEAVGWVGISANGGSAPLAAGVMASVVRRTASYPPLIVDEKFSPSYLDLFRDLSTAQVVPIDGDGHAALDAREVDVVLVVPEGFAAELEAGGRPTLEVMTRDGDETSKLAGSRLTSILNRWRQDVRQVRFGRLGLPPDADQPIVVRDPREERPPLKKTTDELRDAMVRFFPFILIMWAMAGALHPAIDLCAGEKERGTMETLLISPAERGEIVTGKFLAVWFYSTVTTLWNLLWMGGGAYLGGLYLQSLGVPFEIIRLSGLAWCAAFTIPQAALFAAVCLALGAYARSTKEGQYYLMPMFLVVMPLILVSLTPGLELGWLNSLVPVTGSALLLQRLLAGRLDAAAILYAIPAAVSLAVCIALALRWAVAQFHREDVLFREAERLDLGLWLRRMLRRP